MKRHILSYEEHRKHMAGLGSSHKDEPIKRPDETRDYAEYKKKLDSLRGSLAPHIKPTTKSKALSKLKE